MNEYLNQEREKTDENLLNERSETDSRLGQGAQLLSSEISEHLKTRTSLTTRDEFIAIVSHDLRNPIGAAFSCAEMLLEDEDFRNLDPKVRGWVEFMKRNMNKSLRLISDLLDMERVAKGKFELNTKPVEIGELIRHTVEEHAMTASAKTILLQTSPAKISGEALCDPDRINQVLSNLVGNAIKFTPEGGSVTIGVAFQENKIRVWIKDTGPGIPEDRQESIFDRFVQIGTADRSGLGIGLHISKMLVEAHRGQIWVDSKPGEGSTFSFTLPALKVGESLH